MAGRQPAHGGRPIGEHRLIGDRRGPSYRDRWRSLDEWAYRRGVKLDYTRPGKPTDNRLIESFNGRLRDITMHDMRERLRAWQYDYNVHRPHGSLGHLTPSEFVKMRSDQQVKSHPVYS